MTIGIYAITHIPSGKKYIGKSVNIERRLIAHKCNLLANSCSPDTNRHLYNAVQKYGWCQFSTEIVETFSEIDEHLIAERELFWMDFYNTVDRKKGFNLRKDSSTKMIVHSETRELMSKRVGEKNPNFGKKWTLEMREKMSKITSERHANGEVYGEEWRKKQSANSTSFWSSNPEIKQKVGSIVSVKKTKYKIKQYTKDGVLVAEWIGMRSILLANPTFKRHNIYAVCSGEKPSIYGFVWKKEALNGND